MQLCAPGRCPMLMPQFIRGRRTADIVNIFAAIPCAFLTLTRYVIYSRTQSEIWSVRSAVSCLRRRQVGSQECLRQRATARASLHFPVPDGFHRDAIDLILGSRGQFRPYGADTARDAYAGHQIPRERRASQSCHKLYHRQFQCNNFCSHLPISMQ